MNHQPWSLEDGLKLVRAIQPGTRQFGYHLTLGGSVLNTGKSDKDLDLYFLPLSNGTPEDPTALVAWLTKMWGESEAIGQDYPEAIDREKQFQDAFNRAPQNPHVNYMANYIVHYGDLGNGSWSGTTNSIMSPQRETYRFKLKFIRTGDFTDRIDVFIL